MIDSTTPQEWRPVPNLEHLYEVSEYGFVRRLKPGKNRLAGHVIANSKDTSGYNFVRLWHTEKRVMMQFLVHRLVMRAFVGASVLEVNHIDGNKTNNHISNLEYLTHRENVVHSFTHLNRMRTVPRGEKTGSAKLTDEKVIEIRARAAKGETRRALAEEYGVSHVAITAVVNRKTWTHIEEAS